MGKFLRLWAMLSEGHSCEPSAANSPSMGVPCVCPEVGVRTEQSTPSIHTVAVAPTRRFTRGRNVGGQLGSPHSTLE